MPKNNNSCQQSADYRCPPHTQRMSGDFSSGESCGAHWCRHKDCAQVRLVRGGGRRGALHRAETGGTQSCKQGSGINGSSVECIPVRTDSTHDGSVKNDQRTASMPSARWATCVHARTRKCCCFGSPLLRCARCTGKRSNCSRGS